MTFAQIQARFLYLIGETDTTAITAVQKSHINAAIRDILNAFPFSWAMATSDLTLSSGTASLPTTYNPKWHIHDARVGTDTGTIFTEIDPVDRDNDSSDYVYWLTYSSPNFVFNTPLQTGTVTEYHYQIPDDLSGDSDVCIVPDGEAVAYLAASKNWIGDERNTQLKEIYEKEAAGRVQAMYTQDLNFGPTYSEKSKVSDNPGLTSAGV